MKALNSLWVRLILGYAIPVVLFLGAALVAYVTIERLLAALAGEQESQQVLTRIHEVRERIASMAAAKYASYLVKDDLLTKNFEAARAEVHAGLLNLRRQLAGDPDHVARIDELLDLEGSWHEQARRDLLLKAVAPGGALQEIVAEDNLKRGVALLARMRARADEIITAELDVLARRRAEVQRATSESIWVVATAVLVSIIASVAIVLKAAYSITRPIQQLSRAFAELQQGKFEALTPAGPPEIAALVRGFNLMGLALAERTTTLQTSELRYRTVVGTTANLLWTTSAGGGNSDMGSWYAYTGQTPEEAAGDGWLDAVHEEDRDRFVRHWAETVRAGACAETEVRIRAGDGTYRHFSCRSVPIFGANGTVVEWVRTCVDVTKRKQEERLRQEKDAAEAASQAKSEFLAKMSHELRTPLNAVIGMSKMLGTQRFGPLNAKQQDYVTDITRAGEHLLTLINDILDLSKVEAGRMDLFPEPVAVNSTIELVLSTLRTLAGNKGVELRSELAGTDGVIVTDLARFKQILYNLLSNAVKFTPASGSVTIRCQWVEAVRKDARPANRSAARGLRVDVADTGIGISLEDQALLGMEFFQAHRNPNQSHEGTGLGLALTRRLVHLMGGELWFVSKLGQGSCFSFVLPVRQEQPAPASRGFAQVLSQGDKGPGVGGHPPEDRPLVLVVEDHEPTRKLFNDWLHEAGFRTALAADGVTGIELARRLRPRLVLLDVRLPGLDGLQVVRGLKADPATNSLPVVIVSVSEEQSSPKSLGVLDWLVKPISKDKFLARLSTACPSLFQPNPVLTLLVVASEEADRRRLRELLDPEPVVLIEARDASEALGHLARQMPDALLVDLSHSGSEGHRLIATIRRQRDWLKVPIFVLAEDETSLKGLNGFLETVEPLLPKATLNREGLLTRLVKIGLRLTQGSGK